MVAQAPGGRPPNGHGRRRIHLTTYAIPGLLLRYQLNEAGRSQPRVAYVVKLEFIGPWT